MAAIALLTYRALPHGPADDQPTADWLRQFGHTVHFVAWDAPLAGLDLYDLHVLRACWDYHLRPTEFDAWLTHAEQHHRPLHNPPAIVRWNTDKRYLLELQEKGLPVVPTLVLPAHQSINFLATLATLGWTDVVIKPCISASAHNTWRTAPTPAATERVTEMLATGDVLVQPYLPEIEAGEWSLIFFHGQFSHAVRKTPAPGDFRIQEAHGGQTRPATATPELIEAAQAVLAAVPGPLLYARVDGVEVNGQFTLMELELIEPSLYLAHDEAAPGRFARAIHQLLIPTYE